MNQYKKVFLKAKKYFINTNDIYKNNDDETFENKDVNSNLFFFMSTEHKLLTMGQTLF